MLDPGGLGGDGLEVCALLVWECSKGSVSLSDLLCGTVLKQLLSCTVLLKASLPLIFNFLKKILPFLLTLLKLCCN